jgi:hypothetical protein
MFQKILYEWVTPISLTSYTAITDMPNSAQNPVAYAIKVNPDGEQYILENRQRVDFDGSIPGNGLLVWHIHQKALNGRGSNAAHPQQVYPVVASSTTAIPNASASSYGSINSPGTPFPGSAGKTSFTGKTTPAMFSWTGLQPVMYPITEIAEQSGAISFKFMDGPTDPVTNLQTDATGGNVKLTWTAPARSDVAGYRIFRDNILLYTISNKATTTYTQIGVANGVYEYGVTALYDFTESAPVSATVTVTTGSTSYSLPPTNLQGNTSADKAFLTWNRPFNGGWMTIAGSGAGAYSFNEPFTFFAGTSWGPDELKGMDGYQITEIRFHLNETTAASTYQVQVWEENNTGDFDLVASRNFTAAKTAGVKTVALSTPYAIDASKEYRIGVEIYTTGPGGGCFVVDDNPIVPGRNWICEAGDWFLLEDAGFTNNFVTAVNMSSGNPSPPSPVIEINPVKQPIKSMELNDPSQSVRSRSARFSTVISSRIELEQPVVVYSAPALAEYIIYRDGVEVGRTNATMYEDAGLTSETTYSYCVSAIYNNNNASEGVCMELTTKKAFSPYKPPQNVKSYPAGDEVTLVWEAPFSGGEISYLPAGASVPSNATTTASVVTAAIRFEPDDLKAMDGFELTKVRFHPGSAAANYSYVLLIWSGGNGSSPGTEIHQQTVALTNNAWNEITLTPPVPLEIYRDLWIGFRITRNAGSGSFALPYFPNGIAGKSNNWLTGASWSTINVTGGILPIWPISATVEAPSTPPTPTGYKLTRNGADLTTVSAADFTYTDAGVAPGTYNYCVTALYGVNESDAACVTTTVEQPLNPYKPVENAEVDLTDNKATINWDAPFKGGYFGHSAQTTQTAYGLTGIIAARFGKDDLKRYLGTKLTRVVFAVHSTVTTANTAYTVRIFAGTINGEPERLIYSQPVTAFVGGTWVQVNLATHIDINVYEELWIAIEIGAIGTPPDIYRAVVDPGPAVSGKGNVVFRNNAWTTLSAIGGGDFNWAILGYAEPGSNLNAPPALLSPNGVPYSFENMVFNNSLESVAFERGEAPELILTDEPEFAPQIYATPTSYLITRNGATVATVGNTTFSYEDALTETDLYDYCITALYTGDNKSDPTCVDVSFTSECDAQPHSLTATLTDNKVTLDWQFTPVSIVAPKFNIYQDGVWIDDVIGNQYEVTLTDAGTHEFCVTFAGDYCESEPVCVTESFAITDIHLPAASQLRFAGVGESLDLNVTITDAKNYIGDLGLDFYVDVPSWINYTTSSAAGVYTLHLTAGPNVTGVIREDTVRLWLGAPGSTFSLLNGYKIAVEQKSDLSVSMLDYVATATYNGSAQAANISLAAAYSGIGAISVRYDGAATVPVNAGTYTVEISALEGANFDAVTSLSLPAYTVNPAALTIQANNASRTYGEADPAFTVTYAGFVGTDTEAILSGLWITSTATSTSIPGVYRIIASGASHPNYSISFADGWLTIDKMTQTIDLPATLSLYVGESYQASTTSSAGLPVAFISGNVHVAQVSSNGLITAKETGSAIIYVYQNGSDLYDEAQTTILLSVTEDHTSAERVSQSNAVAVFPNPVSQSTPVYVHADMDETVLEGAVITVYTESGSLVKNERVTGKRTKVDLQVAAGTYLLVLKGKEGIVKTLKVIVK